jgi:hypothetical protein
VTALILPFAWPTQSADELYAAAQPLLASDNPADWDAAFENYLDPLARKYPDQYKKEIEDARIKVRDRRELRQALTEGAKADPQTDAERGYLLGLRLAQAGRAEEARTTWQAVIAAFAAVESEKRWVELSRVGLLGLDHPSNRTPHAPLNREPLQQAIKHAKALADAGKQAEADAVFSALQTLADRDPIAQQMIKEARPK